ncbi:MAG: methylated-DNA--[protein]-cysteine S-methyltransferase [Ignavibacteria bacterium]
MGNSNSLNLNTPIGNLQLEFEGAALKSLKIGGSISFKQIRRPLLLEKTVVEQLKLYFKKQLKEFDVTLKLTGTSFQVSVWKELLKIPYGITVSYSDIASCINRPKAYRAVANAIANNPIPIIIPCHRVVHKDGDLSGYTYGDKIKKFLLNLERS